MKTRSQTQAEKTGTTPANVRKASVSKPAISSSIPKLKEDILKKIRDKSIEMAKENLRKKCGDTLMRPHGVDEEIYADLDFIDTGFESVTDLDFLIMHTPLLADRSAVDYHFNSIVHFVAHIPSSVFEHVKVPSMWPGG